jgi:phosphatidylglycerol:prolipoprotein diacylglycerol transferase
LILWKNKEKWNIQGEFFYAYLVLAGVERFTVEFFRLNPRLVFGLSEAQVIAVILIAIGAVGWNSLKREDKLKQS